MGLYFVISGAFSLAGSCAFLVPSLYKTLTGGQNQVSDLWIFSKAIQLLLQMNYATSMFLDPETRKASYVLGIAVGCQGLNISLMFCCKKRSATKYEVIDRETVGARPEPQI